MQTTGFSNSDAVQKWKSPIGAKVPLCECCINKLPSKEREKEFDIKNQKTLAKLIKVLLFQIVIRIMNRSIRFLL